jgi:hypothetical protein
MRTQVWLWRPVRVPPSRKNSVMAVAWSRPNVVMTVRRNVRARPAEGRAWRKARISSMP